MDVQLNKLDSLRIVNVSDGESKRSRPRKGESPLINEIHIYTKDSVSYTLDEPHTIPMEKLARIDLVGKGQAELLKKLSGAAKATGCYIGNENETVPGGIKTNSTALVNFAKSKRRVYIKATSYCIKGK